MKLLQVANVPTKIGGTGACAFTIRKSLPEWKHEIVFVSGERETPVGLENEFECPIRMLSGLKPNHVKEISPNVILFHNTAPNRMPNAINDKVIAVFYQHSALKSMKESRQKCDLFLCVSKYLADIADIDDKFVLYQPCSTPPRATDPRDHNAIGRICTPTISKWDGVETLYSKLSKDHPEIIWHFVGCPPRFAQKLEESTRGRCVFHEASWEARSLLWTWRAVLYKSELKETYGRVVCEAQRSGCIPIMSDHSGFGEQIENGIDGFRCLSDDEFSRAVETSGKEYKTLSAQCLISGNTRGSLSRWRDRFVSWLMAIEKYRITLPPN